MKHFGSHHASRSIEREVSETGFVVPSTSGV
jgi:hypothetical protein